MNPYEKYVLPKLIDVACGQKPMRQLRERYVPRASGKVLEIGIGSGLNLPHYADDVESVTGVDPHARLNAMARDRAREVAVPVEVRGISGEQLDADDREFDSVVCTWTLCSIPNPYAAVREMYRVLKPGGKLYFIEHGLSPDAGVARWQRRIEPLWKIIGGGCHLTRRADQLLEGAGFELLETDQGYQPGPRFAAYMLHGVARAS